jgi:hypothetical protein
MRASSGGWSLGSRCFAGAFVVIAVHGLAALPAIAQTANEEPAATRQVTAPGASESTRPQDRDDSWRVSWVVAVSSTYDNNVFRLSPWQLQELDSGADRFTDMNAGHDMINSLRLRTRFRGPGLAAQRLDLTASARIDAYTLSPRQSNGRFDLAVQQSLTRRDRITAEVSLAPYGSRRHYLSGADESGQPLYTAGRRRSVDGSIGYERTLWRRRRGPELNAALRLTASSQSFPGFSWRDRRELGGEVEAELTAGPTAIELSAGRARADYSGGAEPVLLDDAVTLMELARDFDVTRLEARASRQVSENVRLGLRVEHKTRQYRATLEEDPVYGERRDNGWTYGADLRLRTTRHVSVVLGGDLQRQFAFRPGRGDTGDEARYSRTAAFLRIEYAR